MDRAMVVISVFIVSLNLYSLYANPDTNIQFINLSVRDRLSLMMNWQGG